MRNTANLSTYEISLPAPTSKTSLRPRLKSIMKPFAQSSFSLWKSRALLEPEAADLYPPPLKENWVGDRSKGWQWMVTRVDINGCTGMLDWLYKITPEISAQGLPFHLIVALSPFPSLSTNNSCSGNFFVLACLTQSSYPTHHTLLSHFRTYI